MNGSGLTKTIKATKATRTIKPIKPVVIRRVCGACGKRHDPTAKDKDGKPISSCHQHAKNVREAIAVIRELIKHPAQPIQRQAVQPIQAIEPSNPIEPSNQVEPVNQSIQ